MLPIQSAPADIKVAGQPAENSILKETIVLKGSCLNARSIEAVSIGFVSVFPTSLRIRFRLLTESTAVPLLAVSRT